MEINKEVKTIKFSPEFLNKRLINSLILVEENYYVDHFLISDIFLDVDPYEKTTNNAIVNNIFKFKNREYLKYLKKYDYESIINLLDEHLQMRFIIKNYKKIYVHLGEKKYYKILGEALTYVNHHYPYRKVYHRIINIGNNPKLMMSYYEKKYLERLPEKFLLYRGICVENKITSISEDLRELHLGNSWTLSLKKAEWFSKNHAKKYNKDWNQNLVIISYLIKKKEILAYFSRRNEKEIFINYKKINLKKLKFFMVKS